MAERRNTSPSAEPKKATAQTTPAGDTSREDGIQEERERALQEKVDASTLDAAPADQTGPTGGSFYNPATVGSGTIMPDGTYGAPLPDPNVERLAKLAEDTKDSDTSK